MRPNKGPNDDKAAAAGSRGSAEETARALGISVFNLYKWKRQGVASWAAGAPRPAAAKKDLVAEVERLRRELARMVGWAMGTTLDTAVPLAALRMALRRCRPAPGLVHHSDRGVQYASADYRATIAAHGLVASMSRKGNCYDNAAVEAFWSSLKNDLVHCRRFATRAEARTAIFDYIESSYNRSRRHSALHYLSPPRLRGLSLS